MAVPLVSTLLERDKQVFEYDHLTINHLPIEFTKMNNVLNFGVNGNATQFDFATQSLTSVKAVIYHLCDGNGNSVVIYQHKYPVSLHKKTKKSFLSLNGRTLDKITHDSIDINDTIDFFFFQNKYYALNIKLLERMYGLESVIDNLANNSTPLIINLGIVNTQGMPVPLDIFKDMYKDRAFMRRLAMVSKGNLVKTGVSVPQIQQVMQKFPVFQRNIDLTGGLINLNTKDQKRYFIRLLNNEASFAALDNSPFLAVEKDSAA
ncbi:Kiwa anti-phage protein KwaB-like domain-containing protein [Salmonella enterica]|uniref:Kiwa anti-phage protein KwaB-like domain-containing protein n=1 Tax=Salmonella enterica TaxID=28901 RepID=UPI001FB028A3|nr:Kiwa anti-phage protein KwaB-like domain-containing protein [Salmonella enterica]